MKPHTCPVCVGLGKIEDGDFTMSSDARRVMVVCPACGGRGIVWEESK